MSTWRFRQHGEPPTPRPGLLLRFVLTFAIALMGAVSPLLYSSVASASAKTTTTTSALSTKGLLSLSLLSNGKPQTLSAPSGDAFFTLYVPTGTTPVEFVASMLIRGPVTGGIATITTPTNVYPENLSNVNGTSKFSAPLTAGDVQNGTVNIHVHIDLNLDSKYLNPSGCTATNSVVAQIESASGLLSGALKSPTNPADFWPPQLNRIVVWVPSLAGLSSANARAASLASMQIAATVSQQYGTNTQVSIAQGTPPKQSISPLVRNVLVEVTPSSTSGDTSVTKVGTAPVLVVSGQGASLVREAQAIGVGQLALATSNNALGAKGTQDTTNPLKVTVTANGTREITFAQLGNQTSIEGLGTVDVTQFLSQSQFGAPIRSLQLRLQADYTPPPVGGVATFSVLVGGYIVASQRLSTVGSLVMNANVPVSVLSRTQSVDYRLDYSPPGGFCHAGLVPVQVTINPSSGFAATPGQTLPPGFDRSPQNVAPGINVDLVSMSDANLIDACQLVTTLAQVLPYIPQVSLVPNSQMLTGHENEVVVGATRANSVALKAPISFQPFRTLATNGISIGYTVNQPFAALEAFNQNGRDVILTGAYESTSLVHDLTAAINTSTFGGWFGLGTGQIAIMTPDERVRLVGSGAILTQLTAANPANNLGIPTWLLVGIALIIAAIVLRLLWFWLKLRRLRRAASREQRARALNGVSNDTFTGAEPTGIKRAPVTRIEVETSPRHKKTD